MNTVLSSWKEIAAFLGKGVRTVQRWERQLGLPVHRPSPNRRYIVVADTDELLRWFKQQRRHEARKTYDLQLFAVTQRRTREILAKAQELRERAGELRKTVRMLADLRRKGGTPPVDSADLPPSLTEAGELLPESAELLSGAVTNSM